MTNIKHFLMMILLMLCIMMFSTVYAESDLVAITQLTQATSPLWQQSYNAYGRTIDIDVKISIPTTDRIPIIIVQAAFPIPEPMNSELVNKYESANKKDKVYSYGFESTDYSTYMEHQIPPAWGKTKDIDYNEKTMGVNEYELYEYDINQAYAPNNNLTLKEATDIAFKHLQELFPDINLILDTVSIDGGTYWRKNNKPIQKQTGYNLNMRQCFYNTPIMAGIRETFSNKGGTNWETIDRGTMYGTVYSDSSWYVWARLYQEKRIISDDLPLIPFDTIKEKVESLINKGCIRRIFSVTLGYVQYETDISTEQALFPCWVIWCEYHSTPQSEAVYGINDSDLMFDGNNPYYRPIIINAYTGEMTDPESEADDRFMCPDFSTYE